MFIFKFINLLLMSISWTNVEVEVPVYEDIANYITIPYATLFEDGEEIIDEDMYYVYNGVDNTYYSDLNTNYLGIIRHSIKVVFPNYYRESKQQVVFKIVDKTNPVVTFIPEFTILVGQQIPDLKIGLKYYDNYDPIENITVNIQGIETINNKRVGLYPFFYQVVDQSMNSTLVSSTVKVIDTTAPIIEKLKEIKLEIGQSFDVYTFYKITDNHDTYLEIVVDDSNVDYQKQGSYNIKITATDSSGNAAIRQDTLVITYSGKPILTVYQTNLEIEVMSSNWLEVLKENIKEVSDLVDDLTKDDVFFDHNLDIKKLGTYNVSYKVKNFNNQSTEVVIKVIVLDKTKPTIEIIKPLEIPVGTKSFIYYDYIKISDNFDDTSDLNISINQKINLNELGSYPVIIEVVDQSKNKERKEITAQVIDNIAPEFLFEFSEVELDVYQTYDFTLLQVRDNYDKSPEIFPKSKYFNEVGHFDITLTLEDSSGNITSKLLTFIIKDSESPVINLSTSEIKLPLNSLKLDPKDYLLEVYDNYDNLTAEDVLIIDQMNYQEIGKYNLLYYLTDLSGNEVAESITIIIDDTKAPIIKVENITINKGDNINLLLGVEVIEDSNYELRSYPYSINTNEIGTYHITYIAVDSRGNIAKATRQITIIDKSSNYRVPIYIGINFIVTGGITLGLYVYLSKKRRI